MRNDSADLRLTEPILRSSRRFYDPFQSLFGRSANMFGKALPVPKAVDEIPQVFRVPQSQLRGYRYQFFAVELELGFGIAGMVLENAKDDGVVQGKLRHTPFRTPFVAVGESRSEERRNAPPLGTYSVREEQCRPGAGFEPLVFAT